MVRRTELSNGGYGREAQIGMNLFGKRPFTHLSPPILTP